MNERPDENADGKIPDVKNAEDRENDVASTIGAGIARAAEKSGLGALASQESPSGKALLAAMGGIRGILEAVLPGLVFLVGFTLTRELIVSLIAPVVIGVGFTTARLAQRQPFTQAAAGLIGIALSAVLALLNNKPEDFYLVGFWTNAAYLAGILISVFVGWPVVGLIAGFLMGESTAWKKDRAKRRVFTILTLCWAGLFALRLAVQLPLYFAGNVELLGATRLLMGVPLYAPMLVVTWLVVTALYRRTSADSISPTE